MANRATIRMKFRKNTISVKMRLDGRGHLSDVFCLEKDKKKSTIESPILGIYRAQRVGALKTCVRKSVNHPFRFVVLGTDDRREKSRYSSTLALSSFSSQAASHAHSASLLLDSSVLSSHVHSALSSHSSVLSSHSPHS